MGTFDDYRPERRASLEDIAQAIHDSVMMDEAVAVYAPSPPPRHHRIPCPIHNGVDYNLSYTPHGFKCFVCGASGDVIGFVKEVCELATRSDAMKRINADFRLNLPIQQEISAQQSAEISMRRAEAKRKEEAAQAWKREYERLTDEWIKLDKAKRVADPNSDSYAHAVKNIDFVSYKLDALLDNEPR